MLFQPQKGESLHTYFIVTSKKKATLYSYKKINKNNTNIIR